MRAVVTTFWSLGLIAFGGPAAHVAILREHLVVRRDWISEEQFMELFAIGQVWHGCGNAFGSKFGPTSLLPCIACLTIFFIF
jgi:chromate transport protein ChrA